MSSYGCRDEMPSSGGAWNEKYRPNLKDEYRCHSRAGGISRAVRIDGICVLSSVATERRGELLALGKRHVVPLERHTA